MPNVGFSFMQFSSSFDGQCYSLMLWSVAICWRERHFENREPSSFGVNAAHCSCCGRNILSGQSITVLEESVTGGSRS